MKKKTRHGIVIPIDVITDALKGPWTREDVAALEAELAKYEKQLSAEGIVSCVHCKDGIAAVRWEVLSPGRQLLCRDCGRAFAYDGDDFAEKIALVRRLFRTALSRARRRPGA